VKYKIKCQFLIRSRSKNLLITCPCIDIVLMLNKRIDAINIIYLFPKRSTYFRRFLCPSSGTHNCTHSFRYCQPVLLLAVMMNEMELSSISGWYSGWVGGRDGTHFHLRLVWWLRLNWVPSQPPYQPVTILVDNTWSCVYSYVFLMMGGGTAWNMYSVLEINK